MRKVSIVCTAYNAEQHIQNSIDSVFAQTFQDFELILVDDGSTDNTFNIMLNNKRDNVLIVRNSDNCGIAISRNKAVSISCGEYIAIQDADDVSMPDRIEKEVSVLDSLKDIVFMGSFATKINCSGETIGSMVYPPKNNIGAIFILTQYKLNPIIDPSSMYRKSNFVKHGGYSTNPEIKTVIDLDLWCRFFANDYLMTNIQEPLIKYRINPNGVTQTKKQEMMKSTESVLFRFKESFKGLRTK